MSTEGQFDLEARVRSISRDPSPGSRIASYPRAINLIEDLYSALTEARSAAWWEGVNDQWKHRPIGNRIPDSRNPYRSRLGKSKEN